MATAGAASAFGIIEGFPAAFHFSMAGVCGAGQPSYTGPAIAGIIDRMQSDERFL
jgi:hypothetical protein